MARSRAAQEKRERDRADKQDGLRVRTAKLRGKVKVPPRAPRSRASPPPFLFHSPAAHGTRKQVTSFWNRLFSLSGGLNVGRRTIVEQDWQSQASAAKAAAERLPHGREREALTREARQLNTA